MLFLLFVNYFKVCFFLDIFVVIMVWVEMFVMKF